MKYLLMVVYLAGNPMERPVNLSLFDSREICEKVATRIDNAMSANEADVKYHYCHEVTEPSALACGWRLFFHSACFGYRLTN